MEIGLPEKMFWYVPGLVERLFLFLDPASALCLAQVKVMTKQIFKESFSSKVWRNLIKQCQLDGDHEFELNEEERENVRTLVNILKLLQPKDLSHFLLPLLDLICQRFQTSTLPWWVGEPHEVVMDCPCQEDPHKISLKGFMLLEEEVEGVFGTTFQTLKSVAVEDFWPNNVSLAAVCSRMSRQQEKVTSIFVCVTGGGRGLVVEDNTGIQAVSTLLQAQEVSIDLKVWGSVDQEGWETLARAMKAKPNGVLLMIVSREGLLRARREDVKDIWEAVGDEFIVKRRDKSRVCMEVDKSEGTWELLEKILDMTEKEFTAAVRTRLELDTLGSDEDEEDEDNEDKEDQKDAEDEEGKKDKEGEKDEEDEENVNRSLDEYKAWPQGEPYA